MKKIFITGADRGLGQALCEVFLKNGCFVFAGRYLDYWKELDELKEKYPNTLEIVPLDISVTSSVENAVKLISQKTDYIDMLINCAGIAKRDTEEGFEAVYNVNAVGTLRATELSLPLMQKGMKRICYISSESGSVSLTWRKENIAYPMSKSALNMQIRLSFNQLRPQGYTFRVYHPGAVNGYMKGDDTKSNNAYGIEPEYSAKTAYEQFMNDSNWEDVMIMRDQENRTWSF